MTILIYVAAFFSGAFFANTVPHFVKGICGDPFPTPFAKPPGKGLSSPQVNTVWALFNLVLAFLLFRAGHVAVATPALLLTFFAGIAFLSIRMSLHFQQKHTS